VKEKCFPVPVTATLLAVPGPKFVIINCCVWVFPSGIDPNENTDDGLTVTAAAPDAGVVASAIRTSAKAINQLEAWTDRRTGIVLIPSRNLNFW
jgi:hypothetical protein